MIIKVPNTQTETAPKSGLSSPMTAGTTTVAVKNINLFTDGWAAQFGNTGEEKAEIKVINAAPSGGNLSLSSGLTYAHPADTPVYSIKYDQVIFKRATDGTAGTFTDMTDGTISITPDGTVTQFDDTGGSTSYAYKSSFFSSGLSAESPTSDPLQAAGPSFYSLQKVRERSKEKMLNAASISGDKVDNWTNEWLEKMTNTAIDVNEDYALGTTEVGFSGTAQEGTITAADFKQVRRAWHTTGSTWYRMTKTDIVGFEPEEIFNETAPYYYMKGDNVIGRQPHNNSGTIGITYYKLNAVLTDDADQLPVAMRGYTSSFIKYNEAQAKKDDNKQTEALALEAQAEADRHQFRQEITNRNKSGPTFIDIVEGLPNEDTNVVPYY